MIRSMRSFHGSRGAAVLCAALLSVAAGGQPDILTVGDAGPATPLAVSIELDLSIPIYGWSWGMCHDPAGLAVLSTGLGAVGSTVNGGAPPDFVETEFFSDGWTVGVLIDLLGANWLAPGVDLEIGTATYAGLADGSWTVCPCNTLGSPPVHVVILGDGAALVPVQICGTVEVDVHEFLRGDANIDGMVDIADPIALFDWLFSAGLPLPCEAAADPNGDGDAGVADVIALLAYLFSGGPPPAPPFPACASDPAADCATTLCP